MLTREHAPWLGQQPPAAADLRLKIYYYHLFNIAEKVKSNKSQSYCAPARADLVKFYLALDNKLFQDMAAKTAAAVHGLAPKINVWTQGEGGGSDCMGPLRNLFTSLPPMLARALELLSC
jgi:hypothetical protein